MTARSLPDPERDPTRPWAPSPFGRLARAHGLSVAGDAVFTTAMAGLVFFNVTKLSQARWQVGAALLFTIVPLSLAAPFLGPLIDRARGGRKWMIVGLCLARALVCFLLVLDRDNQLVMYPEFTLVLVFAQGYVLARAALVPATVRNDAELVEANSKLAAISGVAAVAGGATALIVMWTVSKFGTDRGPNVALFLAAVVYVAATVQAFQLPPVRVAAAPPDETETQELHGFGIKHAALAISSTRVVVGFVTFLLAFYFKGLEESDVWGSRAGLVGSVVFAQIGFLGGSALAVRARRKVTEEQMILGALVGMAVGGLLAAVMSNLAGACVMAFVVGLTSNASKQAFDSIVQRDAPDANRGRAFAKFETRFQLWWVVGALVPVVLGELIAPHLGFLFIGLGMAGSAVWFAITRRQLEAQMRRRPSPFSDEPVLVEPRPVSRSFLRSGRGRSPDATDGGFGGYDATVVGPGEGTALALSPSVPATQPAPISPDEPTLIQPPASEIDDDATAVLQPSPTAPPPPAATRLDVEPRDGSPAPWQSAWDGVHDPAPAGWRTADHQGSPRPPAPAPSPASRRAAEAGPDTSSGDDELGFGGSDAGLLADIGRAPSSGLFAAEGDRAPAAAARSVEPGHDPYALPPSGEADGEPAIDDATTDEARLPLMAPDGTYHDIPWRDATSASSVVDRDPPR